MEELECNSHSEDRQSDFIRKQKQDKNVKRLDNTQHGVAQQCGVEQCGMG